MPIQTITLNASDKAFLPKTAKILSVDSVGGITLNPSECINTTPLPKKCYRFRWATSNDPTLSTEEPAWETGHFIGFKMKDVFYSTSIDIIDQSAIGTYLESASMRVIEYTSSNSDTAPSTGINRRDVFVKMPESLATSVYLEMLPDKIDSATDNEIRIYPVEWACPEPIV